jgi:hypothetical protein
MTTHWEALRGDALLGVNRRAFDPRGLAAEGPLQAALAQLDAAAPERALLAAAALLGAHDRAGALPLTLSSAPPQPAPTDDAPLVSPAAERHLRMMLSGTMRDVLDEWLAAAHAAGQRASAELLPDLLDIGAQHRAVRPVISAVIGARGRWLAAHRAEWRYATLSADAAWIDWDNETTKARETIFPELRAQDPARARELLVASFKTESAETRNALLLEMRIGLSLADEPFLESALDDRSSIVATSAARLLGSLRASAYVERMTERARRYVRIGRTSVDLVLPDAFDPTWKRDGLSEAAKTDKTGARALWVLAMLSATPPQVWIDAASIDVETLVQRAAKSEYANQVTEMLAIASARFGPHALTEALLRVLPAGTPMFGVCVRALPRAHADRLTLDLLRETSALANGSDHAAALLLTFDGPWSLELSTMALTRLAQATVSVKKAVANYRFAQLFRRCALHGDARLGATQSLDDWLTHLDEDGVLPEPIHNLIDTLRFRYEIAQSFAAHT